MGASVRNSDEIKGVGFDDLSLSKLLRTVLNFRIIRYEISDKTPSGRSVFFTKAFGSGIKLTLVYDE